MFNFIKNILLSWVGRMTGIDFDAVQNGDYSTLGGQSESSFFSTVGNSFKQILQGIPSLINRYTDAAATGGEIQRNEMQMQNVEDQYQRQVAGMQKAGLNPAMMYQSGASGSAPQMSTGASSPASMSELMQLMLLPQQKDLMRAQAENLRAGAERSGAQAEKFRIEVGLIKARIENADLDAESKRIALEYQDAFARADLAVKEATADKLGAQYEQLMKSVEKMDYDELLAYGRYLECIERISVLEKTKQLTDAQIRELAALTDKLNAEKSVLDKRIEDWDFLNGFVTNESLSVGVKGVAGSGSGIVTLGDLKKGARNNLESLGNRRERDPYGGKPQGSSKGSGGR